MTKTQTLQQLSSTKIDKLPNADKHKESKLKGIVIDNSSKNAINSKHEEDKTNEIKSLMLREFAKEKKESVYRIDPNAIKILDHNIRIGELPKMEELKLSIIENGVIEPIYVYRLENDSQGFLYAVEHGYRRVTASKELNVEGYEIETIPTFIIKKPSEYEEIISHLIKNSGVPLTSFEEGSAYEKLSKKGHDLSKVAKSIGRSVAHISNMRKIFAVAQSEPIIESALINKVVTSTEILKLTNDIKRENNDNSDDYNLYEEIGQTIDKAVEIAKEEGKSKATAKHIEKAKAVIKKDKVEKSKIEKSKAQTIEQKEEEDKVLLQYDKDKESFLNDLTSLIHVHTIKLQKHNKIFNSEKMTSDIRDCVIKALEENK